jgi:tRNA(adenine34) deaminase
VGSTLDGRNPPKQLSARIAEQRFGWECRTCERVNTFVSSAFMRLALAEAEAAGRRGEVPVGAALVDGATGRVLACAGNRVKELADPTAHAEMLAIRAAARQSGASRLTACDLYVTLEPCTMCASAISLARVRRLYFGAYDPKGGGVEHGARVFALPTCNHRPEVYGGVDESAARALLLRFFADKR